METIATWLYKNINWILIYIVFALIVDIIIKFIKISTKNDKIISQKINGKNNIQSTGDITICYNKDSNMGNKKKKEKNAWVNGSFYLVVVILIMTLFCVISNKVEWYALPIVIIGGLLTFTTIGAFQLRNDDGLTETNFLKLMIETFKRLPLLKSEKKFKNKK